MYKTATITGVALATLLAASPVLADNPLPKENENIERYGKVGDWTAYANKTRRNCYIARVDGPNAVQMGVTADRNVGYLGVFTKNRIDVKNNKKNQIFVAIDGTVYAGVATQLKGHIQGGYSGGYFLVDSPEFKRDLAKKYEMIVFPDTEGAFIVDLKGTYKAMDLGRKCMNEVRSN